MGEHQGGEAAVGEAVEVTADGVEGEKMVDIEVADHFEGEFGAFDEAIEDPVVLESNAGLWRIAFGWCSTGMGLLSIAFTWREIDRRLPMVNRISLQGYGSRLKCRWCA